MAMTPHEDSTDKDGVVSGCANGPTETNAHASNEEADDEDNAPILQACSRSSHSTTHIPQHIITDDEDDAPLTQVFGQHAEANSSITQIPQHTTTGEGMAASSGSRVGLPRGSENPRFDVHGPDGTHLGQLVWNRAANSIDAHCNNPLHADGLPCAVNRTVNVPTKARPNQGRPLGLLTAWLAQSRDDDFPNRNTHFASRLDSIRFSRKVRKRGRKHILRQQGFKEWCEDAGIKEYAEEGEKPKEPLGLP